MNRFEKGLLTIFLLLALFIGLAVLSPIMVPLLITIVMVGAPIWVLKLSNKLAIKKYEKRRKKINTDRKAKK